MSFLWASAPPEEHQIIQDHNKCWIYRFSESVPTIDSSMLNWQCFDARAQLSKSDRRPDTVTHYCVGITQCTGAKSDMKCSPFHGRLGCCLQPRKLCDCVHISETHSTDISRNQLHDMLRCIRRRMARIFACTMLGIHNPNTNSLLTRLYCSIATAECKHEKGRICSLNRGSRMQKLQQQRPDCATNIYE